MSNIFKSTSNSRFDVLNKKEEKIKHVKSEPVIKGNNSESNFKGNNKNNSFTANFDVTKKQVDIFDDSSFPELTPSNQKKSNEKKDIIIHNNKISFTDILKKEKEKEENDHDIIKKTDEINKNHELKQIIKNEDEDDYVDPNIVFNKLVELHLKWKTEYIENWGIDEYEHHYLFPNYDYEYFDKLDALDEDNETDISYDYDYNDEDDL